jgi:polysaccharide pyruvyl transferase CsaB
MNGFVIFGYYGRGNLGDETNLRELVAFIRRVKPDADITVISADPEQTAQRYQVTAVGKFHLIDICYALWHADILIGGGGSLFQDRTSLRSLVYYSSLVLLAKISRLRILMYGQGIGPLRSFLGRAISGWVLSMADLITVRDRLSIIALAELNVRKSEIFITAEPLIVLREIPRAAVNSYWHKYPSEKRFKVGLIIQENGFMKKKFWHQLVECIGWTKT